MTHNEFKELTLQGPIILDGATGSNLMKAGMPSGTCTEKWILEHPDVFTDLQRSYMEAGSQIVYAPTFAANRVSLKKHKLDSELETMIPALVALSRSAVGTNCYVAGDMTTTGDMMITYEDAYEVYKEQITCLNKAGVDLLIAETMLSKEECLAAVNAAKAVCDLPIMCSITIMPTGYLFFGGTIFEVGLSLQEAGAAAVGINCSSGPDQLEEIIAKLSETLDIPVIAKPNAGIPEVNGKGEAVYNMSSPDFAGHMKRLVDLGAGIVGGCCGTTPEYIEELVSTLK